MLVRVVSDCKVFAEQQRSVQRSRQGCGSAGASPSRHCFLPDSQRHGRELIGNCLVLGVGPLTPDPSPLEGERGERTLAHPCEDVGAGGDEVGEILVVAVDEGFDALGAEFGAYFAIGGFDVRAVMD
jgi:hypothetical protein